MNTPILGTSAAPRPQEDLVLRGVRRLFGATRAVDGVDVTVRPGMITALMGANGSGKSTLVKIIAGVLSADDGSIDVGDGPRPLGTWDAAAAHAAGFRFVHQDLGLFPAMTVADNLAVGHGFPVSAVGRIRGSELRDRARRTLERLGNDIAPEEVVGDLSPGSQALVAIGRALQEIGVRESVLHRTLVLDEPTAALGQEESSRLLNVLSGLASRGAGVLYIGHRLAEIFTIADHIIVMRDGRVVLDCARRETSRDHVVGVMVTAEPGPAAQGQSTTEAGTSRSGTAASQALLECRALRRGPLRSVNVCVAAGQIVGIAGLQGAGRSLLLRCLYGDLQPEAGDILVNGRSVSFRSPRQAIAHGLALVPSDRGREGVFPGLTVRENMLVPEWRRYRGRLLMNRKAQQRATDRGVQQLSIRTAGDAAGIGELSGGNQQKVVLARWLLQGARVLLLDEPTQGVDVVARRDLWKSVRQLVDDGGAALVVSSDFEELAEVSDEVLVLRGGRITQVFGRAELDEEALNRACQGVDHEGR